MTVFALNESDDIYLDETGQLALLDGLDEVCQNVSTRVRTFKNEIFYNPNLGVDYNSVFSGSGDLVRFRRSLREQTLQVKDVLDVTSIEVSLDGDQVNYEMTISTTFGEASINGGL